MNNRPSFGPFNHIPYCIRSCQIIKNSSVFYTEKKLLPTKSTTSVNSLKMSSGTETSESNGRCSGEPLEGVESYDISSDIDAGAFSLCYQSSQGIPRGPIESRIEKYIGISKDAFSFNQVSFYIPKVVKAISFDDYFQKKFDVLKKTTKNEVKKSNKRRIPENILLDNINSDRINKNDKEKTRKKNAAIGMFLAFPLKRMLVDSLELSQNVI